MTFNNITKDTTCICFDETAEDTVSTFARVLFKEKATNKDFFSHWEKNHRSDECGKICGLKGVSVSKISDTTVKDKIVNYYSSIFKISPNYKRGILLFKLKKDAGVYKSTKSRDNPQHNDLFKSDTFDLNLVEEVETCYLKPVVV